MANTPIQRDTAKARLVRFDVALCVGAAAVYLCRIGDWSMWLDETTSLFYSRRLELPFARSSVAYFYVLDALFDHTGISVTAGRILSAAFGVVNVWLVNILVRRCARPRAGILAAALFGASLFHVFWAQSIRYYTMLLTAEIAASLLLNEAIARRRASLMLLAGLLAAASLWVHYSAIFMIPAWGLYLALIFIASPHENAKSCALAAVLAVLPFAVAAGMRYPAIQAIQASGGVGDPADAGRMLPLLMRYGFYVGAPTCLLAVLGASSRAAPRAGRLLLTALAIGPLGGTFVVSALRLANVSIHHGFLSLVGLAGLAGVALDRCIRPKWFRRTMVVTAAGYYAVELLMYFTIMHGDRPRWKEAAEAVSIAATDDNHDISKTPIYATEPCVLAYYLGVPANKTLDQDLVSAFEGRESLRGGPGWIVVEFEKVSPNTRKWLDEKATRTASFEAHTGPRDRTVAIFRVDSSRVRPFEVN